MDLALDPRSGVALADYTWLPAEYHQAFQSTLETDEGVAAVHFVAEIDRMTKKQYQRRVIVASADAVYLCTTTADITRCVLLDRIGSALVCDEWICLAVPNEYDLVFRVTPNNRGKNCHQRFVLDTLNALIRQATGNTLPIQTLTSIHSLASRTIERPPNFADQSPVPIDVIRYEDMGRLQNAGALVSNLLPQHAAMCDVRPSPGAGPSTRSERIEVEMLSGSRRQPAQPASPRGAHEHPPPPTRAVHDARKHFEDAALSPMRLPEPRPRMVDDATSPLVAPAAARHRDAATIVSPRAAPADDWQRSARKDVADDRLNVLWEEMREQRALLDELRSQVGLLIADRFPVERRPGSAAVDAAVGHASVPRRPPYQPAGNGNGFVSDEEDAQGRRPTGASPNAADDRRPRRNGEDSRRDDNTHSRKQLPAEEKPMSSSPRETKGSRLRREYTEESTATATRRRQGFPPSPARRKRSADSGARRTPMKVEEAVSGLGELSAFQRQLMADYLRDRPVSPHALKTPRQRATPENPHPAQTMFVRTRFDDNAKSPSRSPLRRRASLVSSQFYADPAAPHHRVSTNASRAFAQATRR
jgi:hypothetical protein